MLSASDTHRPTYIRRLVLLAVPLTLAALEVFHPDGSDVDIIGQIYPRVNFWLALHMLQLPLAGLVALGLWLLLDGVRNTAATISRVALAIFVVFFSAFDTLAGLAQGLVVRYAFGLPPDQRQAFEQFIWELNFSPVALVNNALAGLGWAVAAIAAAFALSRAGAARGPVILLALSSIFAMHIPPTGPLGLLFFAAAAAWLELAPRRLSRRPSVAG